MPQPMSKRYSITTPIYYVNSVPHIGTGLTTFASDVTKRYQQMLGKEVWFLTGTDENGQKVSETAEAAGRDPMEFVTEIADTFKEIWRGMDIQFDDFIRTTEPRHIKAAQAFFTKLKENGHIYAGKYEGWYDVSTETWYKEADLVDGKSPDGNEVRWVEEDNWFFKLSAFQDQLLSHIEANPEFILPASRKNEVVSFINQGLRDVCISRSNSGWGVPIAGDEDKVIYVWFDALINYVAATGWPDKGWEDFWPADVQWMGKDILTRFHATLWPAMLMGMDLPLPKHLVGHGWLLMGGDKISKSKGNVVAPLELAKKYAEESGADLPLAIDAVRHYMGATLPFENDSTFTQDDFNLRCNVDLANDLGNALNRSLTMAHKFADGVVPDAEPEESAIKAIQAAKAKYEAAMSGFRIEKAVDAALDVPRFLNKYVDDRAPWALAKNSDPALDSVLRSMLLCLRAAEGMIKPVMPSTATAIAKQLGLDPISSWDQIGDPASMPSGTKLEQPSPLFPRLDIKKQQQNQQKQKKTDKPKKEKKMKPKFEVPAEIEFTDFMKVKLQIGRVLEAEEIEGSKKLLKIQVKVGDEQRQVLAGIKGAYEPMDLIGRQVVVATNLKTAKLMGHESQGMILAADDADGSAILLQPDKESPEGTSVH
jgi:methionyl-tRNA synthetase